MYTKENNPIPLPTLLPLLEEGYEQAKLILFQQPHIKLQVTFYLGHRYNLELQSYLQPGSKVKGLFGYDHETMAITYKGGQIVFVNRDSWFDINFRIFPLEDVKLGPTYVNNVINFPPNKPYKD